MLVWTSGDDITDIQSRVTGSLIRQPCAEAVSRSLITNSNYLW